MLMNSGTFQRGGKYNAPANGTTQPNGPKWGGLDATDNDDSTQTPSAMSPGSSASSAPNMPMATTMPMPTAPVTSPIAPSGGSTAPITGASDMSGLAQALMNRAPTAGGDMSSAPNSASGTTGSSATLPNMSAGLAGAMPSFQPIPASAPALGPLGGNQNALQAILDGMHKLTTPMPPMPGGQPQKPYVGA